MERYEILCNIDQGAQGLVRKARDRENDNIVAVKVIKIAKDDVGVPSFIIREISFLKELTHPNVISLQDVVANVDKVNLIFHFMDFDLNKFMEAKLLVPHLVKRFLHQILSGLAYCHAYGIIHRDLKPRNLLISAGNDVKIADFGGARPIDVPQSSHSDAMATVPYVAPEILYGSNQHSAAVDVWSVGCVFAEMVKQKPLFDASNKHDLAEEIIRTVGTPTEETWPGVSSLCIFFGLLQKHEAKDLREVVPGLEAAGIDLLSRMLRMNPSQRITASEALEHEYFDGLPMIFP